jgi:hypothetical protein
MEHPEKALFDEVRGLRSQLEESKERILTIEKDYKEKVVYLEKRCAIDERCEEKLNKYENDLNNKVTFIINEKEYPFFKSTFTENIYKSRLINNDENKIRLDIQKKDFKGLIHIIRLGHNYYNQTQKSIRRKFNIDKNLKDNPNFHIYLERYFELESFTEIINDFDISTAFTGSVDKLEDLFEECTCSSRYIHSDLEKYNATDIQDILKLSGQKAYFVNYSANLDIKLKQQVRINRFYIKPFQGNNWISTNGHTYTLVYYSLDGANWNFLCNVPSTYGGGQNNYLTEIYFNLTSLRYLRFATTPSYQFSLAYIGLNK